MGEEEGYSSGSDSRISQQHHQLRILPNLEITVFFQKEEECNVHVPYRACQRLLFRLESYIFIDSFELNVSPIAPCFNIIYIDFNLHLYFCICPKFPSEYAYIPNHMLEPGRINILTCSTFSITLMYNIKKTY